jgi:hypothetical protein
MSRVRLVVAGMALLIVLYVGAYAALLHPGTFEVGGIDRVDECRSPAYRTGGGAAATVFRPALRVGRRIRPDYWA